MLPVFGFVPAASKRGKNQWEAKRTFKTSNNKARSVKTLYDSKENTVDEIGEALELSRATCYQYLDVANELGKIQEQKKLRERIICLICRRKENPSGKWKLK